MAFPSLSHPSISIVAIPIHLQVEQHIRNLHRQFLLPRNRLRHCRATVKSQSVRSIPSVLMLNKSHETPSFCFLILHVVLFGRVTFFYNKTVYVFHSVTKLRKTRKHKEEQERNFLPPIKLPSVIAHLFPVGLTNAWPTATFLLLFLPPRMISRRRTRLSIAPMWASLLCCNIGDLGVMLLSQ